MRKLRSKPSLKHSHGNEDTDLSSRVPKHLRHESPRLWMGSRCKEVSLQSASVSLGALLCIKLHRERGLEVKISTKKLNRTEVLVFPFLFFLRAASTVVVPELLGVKSELQLPA